MLEFRCPIYVEEFSGYHGKRHAFVVFLQMVIDFCGDERCELTLGERFIFVECLTREELFSVYFGKLGGSSYICPTEFAISVHSRSTCESSCFSANTLS